MLSTTLGLPAVPTTSVPTHTLATAAPYWGWRWRYLHRPPWCSLRESLSGVILEWWDSTLGLAGAGLGALVLLAGILFLRESKAQNAGLNSAQAFPATATSSGGPGAAAGSARSYPPPTGADALLSLLIYRVRITGPGCLLRHREPSFASACQR